MLPCNINLPPQFISPVVTTYELMAGDSVCFNVKILDPNSSDSVFLSATSEVFNPFAVEPKATFTGKKSVKTVNTNFCLQTFCSSIREAPYKVTFNGKDSSCYGINPITLDVNFYVGTIDGTVKDPIPNVFTPNGDNKNDKLKIKATVNNCFDSFYMKIYDRWGNMVYETTDFLFEWDGRHYKSSKALPEGVYYYLFEGVFRDTVIKKNGIVNLLR